MNIRTKQFAERTAGDGYWHTLVFIKELIIPFDLHLEHVAPADRRRVEGPSLPSVMDGLSELY